jgi:hypothetical protein
VDGHNTALKWSCTSIESSGMMSDMNTQKLSITELKAHIKELAAKEEQHPFMLFIENGNYFHYEGHTDYDHQVGQMIGASIQKNSLGGGARHAVLETHDDRLRLWSQEVA